jgi:hypothetical protein
MNVSPPHVGHPVERLQAKLEPHPDGVRMRISVEGYDETRGWCTIGSIDFPLHQLPLLEQALAEIKALQHTDAASKIIAFPGVYHRRPGAGTGSSKLKG